MGAMPAWVRALPKPVSAALKIACDGDWRRVERGKDGRTWKVVNQPSTALRPSGKTFRTLERPEAKAEPVRAPREAAKASPAGPDNGWAERFAKLRAVAQEPTGWEPGVNVVEQKPDRSKELKPIVLDGHGHDDASPLNEDEILASAFSLATRLKDGLGAGITITIYEEVLASTGLNVKEAERIVRYNPDMVTIRPESAKKGYPVLRFSKADISVIVGFREPHRPAILRIDQESRRVHDRHHVNHMGGAGGTRKRAGNPTNGRQVYSRLEDVDGVILKGERESDSVEVFYKKQSLGRFSPRNTEKLKAEGDWNRLQRRIQAIDRR